MSDIHNEVVNALRAQLHKSPVPTTMVAPLVAPVYVAKEDEVLYSTVFGYVPTMGDFPVKVCAVHPDSQVFIPPVDADYVVQKDECATLVAGLMDGDKTLITGPTGSGKSSLVRYVCAKLQWPFLRVNMSGDVESASLFGSLVVEDGATIWRDGVITEACKYGAVALVDEWELMPADIAMGMQNLLEDGGFLYLKEKPGTSIERTVHPADGFRLVFAGNTVGQGDTTGAFNGVGVQNTATIDRFTNTVKLNYLSASHEVDVITSRTEVAAAVAKKMVEVANLVRAAYNEGKLGLTISPRTLINWGKKMKRYECFAALNTAFLQKLTDEDKGAVTLLYKKVF